MKTEVKERPILFSGEMVRAILNGRKTQTRRLFKAAVMGHLPYEIWSIQVKNEWAFVKATSYEQGVKPGAIGGFKLKCPYGQPGDRLWVRETWADVKYTTDGIESDRIIYRANQYHHEEATAWKPSIYMPRWASRILLEITEIRVERLQDISEEDAKSEGCTHTGLGPHISADEVETAREQFCRLWDSINAKRGYEWISNPWVWVIEFEKI